MTDSRPLIIGIGASAGGLEAFTELLESLGGEQRLAVVLVQQLPAGDDRLQADLLESATDMPVKMLNGPTEVQAGTVYICPPRSVLDFNGGQLIVEHDISDESRPVVIDRFFSALADSKSERAAGVILSGSGSDGTLGLKAISDAGGLTFAQDAESAKFDSMPRNAALTGVADYVMSPKQIAAELSRFADYHEQIHAGLRSPNQQEQLEAAIPLISAELLKATDHNFLHYKTKTLSRRIVRRMLLLKLHRVEEYIARVQNDPNEAQDLFRELLIGVTAFFRDPSAFETLAENILPAIFSHRPDDDPVRIWCPGCATGEEPYSIAILCAELMERIENESLPLAGRMDSGNEGAGRAEPAPNPPLADVRSCPSKVGSMGVQIFASDIDERALAIARGGIYPSGIADHVPADLLAKYFSRRGKRFQIVPKIREMVLFSSHNLISDPPFSRQDLICCRNLLIYLGPHLQKKLIPLFHYALRPNGHLFLGPSESIAQHTDLFRSIDAKHRISQRKGTAVKRSAPMSIVGQGDRPNRVMPAESQAEQQIDVVQIMQRIVLDEFAPKSVVVDEAAQIVCSSSDLSRYLTTGEGTFENNIVKMARRGLRIGLRATLAEAKRKRRRITHENVAVQTDQGKQRVMITVQPMMRVGEGSGLFMVVFHDVGLPMEDEGIRQDSQDEENLGLGSLAASAAERMIDQLERELDATRDDLENSMQEMEAANEELKSSNEELLSMNEELQSANEELETSKEEIRAGSDALSRVNSDLKNLLRSSRIATIFLDEELCIRSFTPAVAEIYELIATDIGRPLSMFVPKVKDMPALTPRPVANPATVDEHIVEADNGRFYARKVLPYMTGDDRRDGFVVTFSDVTELKRSEMEILAASRQLQTFADVVPPLMAIVDRDERFMFANRAYAERWQHEVNDIIGHKICEIVSEQAYAAIAPQMVRARSGETVTYELELTRPGTGDPMVEQVVYVPRLDADGEVEAVHVVITDMTDRVVQERRLAEAHSKLGLAIEVAGLGTGRLDYVRGAATLSPEAATIFGFPRSADVAALPMATDGDRNADEPGDGSITLTRDELHTCFDPADAEMIYQSIARCLDPTGDGRCDINHRIVSHDGEVRWVSVRKLVHFNHDVDPPVPTEGILVVQDVTQRKQSEIELAEREAHLRRVINNQLGLVGVIDREGNLVEVDDRSLEIACTNRDDVIGKHFADAPWWNYDPAVSRQMREAMQRAFDGEVVRYDVSLFAHGEDGVLIDFMIAPVKNEAGEVEFLVPSGVDVRDRKAYETKIEQSERFARTVLESSPDCVKVLDADGRLVMMNVAGMCQMEIDDFDPLRGREWCTLWPLESQAQVSDAINQARKTGEGRFQARCPTAKGTPKWWDVIVTPVRDGDTVDRFVSVSRDITKQHVAEENLAFRASLLDELNGLDSTDEMMQVVTRRTAEHFDANRCYLVDIDTEHDIAEVYADYSAELPSLIGRYDLNDFLTDEEKRCIHEDKPRRIDDVYDSSRSPAQMRRFDQLQFRSFAEGHFTGENNRRQKLIVTKAQPYHWRDEEMEFLRDLAELVHQSIAYVRARDDVHTANAKLSALLSENRVVSDRLKLTMQTARMGSFEWNSQTDEARWDDQWCHMAGLPRDAERRGETFFRLIHPDDLAEVKHEIERSRRDRSTYQTEFRLIEPNGDVRWIAGSGSWQEDSRGRRVLLVGLNWDITQRKQTALIARTSEQRLRMAAEAAGFGTFEIDLDQQQVNWSDEMKRLIGLGPESSVEPHIGELPTFIHPEDGEEVQRYMEAVLADTRTADHQSVHRIVRPDGVVRHVRMQSRSLFAGKGKNKRVRMIVGTLLDITQQREYEMQLEAARQQAEAANESKSAFVANMSHEIRTPMTAILGYAELLQDHVTSGESLNYLSTIRRNGDYLLEIINDILDLSKIEAGKLEVEFERFEPVKVIEDVRSIMEVRASENMLDLSVEYDGALPKFIQSDAKRLKQILINLVGNAIKFTREGRVSLRTRYEHSSGAGHLQVDIVDTGIGMSEEQQDKLFNPFSQGDSSVTRDFGGTGLGLAISQRLAEMLGGKIKASSTEGVGSTFTVTIETGDVSSVEMVNYADQTERIETRQSSGSNEPMRNETDQTSEIKRVDGPATPATELNCHVLIVDDRRDIRILSKMLLTKAGATVDECEDGQIAVDHMTGRLDNGEAPDLILLDMQMPNLDGYETARQLRQLGYAGPIIALTADAMQGDMNECIDAGCNDYLSKPIDATRLVELVGRLTGD